MKVLSGLLAWAVAGSKKLAVLMSLALIASPLAAGSGQTQEAQGMGDDVVELVRVASDGANRSLSPTRRRYRHPRVSPDGKAVIFSESKGSNGDVWSLDIERDEIARLTFSESRNFAPLWSPNGASFVFTSSRSGHPNIWIKEAEGASEPQHLMPSDGFQVAHDWSSDGRYLVFLEFGAGAGGGLRVLDFESGSVEPYLVTEFKESNATFSPDSHWIAYGSDETGQNEIYVRSFPLQDAKWAISNDGGSQPGWSPDGRTIYYRGADDRFYAVAVEPSDSGMVIGSPVVLFDDPYARFTTGRHWDVTPDGDFIFLRSDGDVGG
jgi:Tol biopolymer transport system component